jgi:AraC-like DNA-binding protein
MARRARLEQTRSTPPGRTRGLVSSRSSGRRIDVHSSPPPDDLADVVALFWAGRWDLRGQPPHITELLGDPSVHIVFEEGGPHAGSRVVGVWTNLWRRRLDDRGRVRGVKLRPGAVRAFVSAPAFELTDRIVPLASVFGAEVAPLERQVLAPEDDDAGFALLGDWLRARRRPADPQVGLAVAIADRIGRDLTITTVDRLAAIAGLGPRALEQLFRDHVGASPKWMMRRHRLQEVASRIDRDDGPTLARLAAELGYSDQAHLARDVKRVVGTSPSQLAARMRR